MTVSISGSMLTASATNVASRGALGAKERVIDVRSLRAATWTAASALKNGRIALVTGQGKTALHFRKKQQSQMRAIFDAIVATAPPQATDPAAKDLVDAASFAHDKTTATDLRSDRADDARELAEMITAARTYDGGTPEEVRASGFIIQPDERLYGVFVNAMLIEPRRAPGHYAGTSAGLSFRLAKGVQYRVGQQRGVFQPGPESPTVIDHGDLAITTRRVIFRGLKQSREWEFGKLLGVEHAKDGSWSALSLRNRQKTSGFGYSADIADAVRFRFELALSTYRGDPEAYLTQLENELHALGQD